MYKVVFDLSKGGVIKSLIAKKRGIKNLHVKQVSIFRRVERFLL